MAPVVIDLTEDRYQDLFVSLFAELQGGGHWTTWPPQKLDWYSARLNDKLVEVGESLRSLQLRAQEHGGDAEVGLKLAEPGAVVISVGPVIASV